MTKSKKSSSKSAAPIVNRRARFDYELGDELVAGLVLTGLETRAARDGHIQLKGSYVTIKDGELWLNNASFSLKLNERGKPGARSVDTDGSLGYLSAYVGHHGVRPAFFVESGITLSVEPDQVELSTSALLAEFTSKQLVEEVLRRIAEGQEDGDDDEEDDF